MVVVENAVRGGKRAGPRVAAQQPARGQPVERFFQPDALARALARLSLGEEQRCAQLVALYGPDLAQSKVRRIPRHT